MHFHIWGIGGTFMGGLAALLVELGHRVSGSDQQIYPPMSTQLAALGVELSEGYDALTPAFLAADYQVVGNVMRRGMPVIEALLNEGRALLSGPECLARFVLYNRRVLALSGTHGKTTLSSLVAWILQSQGLEPGFLIGGVPNNFGISARLGHAPYFVIEADEYDSAFFDKRSKFVHYRPEILVINNIEFDHADIFSDVAAIQQQFHHCVRTVPARGRIIYPVHDAYVAEVLAQGCWTPCTPFDGRAYGIGASTDLQTDSHAIPIQSTQPVSGVQAAEQSQALMPGQPLWWAKLHQADGSDFEVFEGAALRGRVQWPLLGQHNVHNALAAIVAAEAIGVPAAQVIQAMPHFLGVKRRLEILGQSQGIMIYDDFAHHPTAIHSTLSGLRAKIGANVRLVAVLDIRSNTMQAGHHQDRLADALAPADRWYCYAPPSISWALERLCTHSSIGSVHASLEALQTTVLQDLQAGDHLVFMSNGGFGGIQHKVLGALEG